MSEHFSEMFKRWFPEELKRVKTFAELQQNFKVWGKEKAPMTQRRHGQVWALGIEAKKLGIENTSIQVRFMRNNKQQIRYKDVVTGIWTRPDGTYKTREGKKK
jgi:hypothetical protein